MKFEKIILTTIILLAVLLRVINVQNYPPSLNWDEVSHGYNAYSILKTGRDEWGTKFPLIFRAFGDYKLPVYIYLTVPSVLFFGPNPFSVRLVSILAGTLLPLFIFLIVKQIFPKKTPLPLFAASITAFSPGFIFLSRIALEANLFVLFFSISLYLILIKKYPGSSFFYALCLLTYNSSRVILPFYLILLTYILIKNKYNFFKNWFKFLPIIIVLAITIFQLLNTSGQARYQWVSILDSGSINKINELRQNYPRFLVNKATFFVFTASKNYLSHFNPNFIFFNGGSNYQFSLPNFYIISPLFLPFFILGILVLFKNIKKDKFKLLLFWLLVSPLPSSITRDAPHILRGIIFLPIVVITIVLGFSLIYSKFPKISILYLTTILVSSLFLFWPKYKAYSINYSSSWQFGYQEAVSYIKENYSSYDQIIITKKYGEAHEFLLFNWPWDPKSYQNDSNLNRDFHANWYWVNAFDKFKFVNDWEIKKETETINSKTLLITSPGNYNKDNNSLIKTVYFVDKKPAFDILSIYDQK